MIRIIVDSSADYALKELKEKNIELIPISIAIEEQSYTDGIDLDRNELYGIIEKSGEFPKTSQPSPAVFQDIFEDVKAKKDEIICILLSSALSGTYQSAMLIREMTEYDGIHIIDSRAATAAIKIMADYACELREKGLSAKDIVEKIEKLKSRIKIVASLDTLEYLYRGGRLNRATAVIGNTVRLKPIITLPEDGTIKMMDKQIGKKHSMGAIIRHMHSLAIDDSFPIYSLYSYGTENSEIFEEKLQAEGFAVSRRIQIGATIGSHIGPGAFGIVFVLK
ncbi:MAG: DegV family protein [Lachnospiraceae bacterium]